MGLNLTYGERHHYNPDEEDREFPMFFRRPDVPANCQGKEYGDYSCEGCPLSCEADGSGCYPRMGSYGYVASLYKFCADVAPYLLNNTFVKATHGGGFHPQFKLKDVEGLGAEWGWGEDGPDEIVRTDKNSGPLLTMLLADAEKLRAALAGLQDEAAVLRDAEGNEISRIGASPQLSSISTANWFASGPGGSIGVHRGHGIWTCPHTNTINQFGDPAAGRREIAAGQYVQEATDPTLLEHFMPWGMRQDGVPKGATLKMENVPALPRFEHLLDTFKRIAEKALEHGLSVEGC